MTDKTEPAPAGDYDGYNPPAERLAELEAERDRAQAEYDEAWTAAETAKRLADQPPPERHDLIAICERACTPEQNWTDRDSSAAVRQLGEAYALLRAGCAFTVEPDESGRVWWVTIRFRGFDWFEGTGDAAADRGEERDELLEEERFYLPMAHRLEAEGDGRDWY